MKEYFGDVLKEYVDRAGQTAGQLAKITGIPRQTIVSWLEGRVKRLRAWQDVVRLAAALRLYEEEADRLLLAAGQRTIGELMETAVSEEDETTLSLLAHWRKLRAAAEGQPAPAGIKAAPFQAPRHAPDFVGRDGILVEVEAALLQGTAICIVQGMGGVGKTALATRLAYTLRRRFPDGVLWADLSHAVAEGRLDESVIAAILRTFAEAYGRTLDDEYDLESRGRIVREVLANKKALVVLDNAQGTADVTPLLPPPTGGCAVLITTRNRKMLRSQAKTFTLNPFTMRESLDLFRQIVGEERVAGEKAGSRRLIDLVGGLPLAVKVIASALADTASITFLEYHDLLLDERSRLEYLTDWEDASKDVRASFALSFNRLSAPLQKLFASLAVFAGPDFSAEAAAAVVDAPPVITKTQLGRLAALSLLQEEAAAEEVETGATSSGVRYRLHPLLRLFAQEKLEAIGEEAVAERRERAADYFSRFVRENRRAYHLLDREWPHVAAALRRYREKGAWDRVYEDVMALTAVHLGAAGFLEARGYWQEATTLLAQLLDSSAAAEKGIQAALRYKLALFAFRQADEATAEAQLQQTLSLLDDLPADEDTGLLRARGYDLMAQLTFRRGDAPAALTWSERGIVALRALDAPAARGEEGYSHIQRAGILARTGKLHKALAVTETGLSLLPPEPTPARVSGLLIKGNILFYRGEIEQALAQWEEAITLAQALGDARRLANLWQNIGAAETNRGHIAHAVAPKEKALALYEQIGDVEGAAYIHSNLGEDYILLHQYETAQTHLTTALEAARQHQSRQVELYALINQARWQLDQDQIAPAATTLQRTNYLAQELELTQQQIEATRLQSELTYHQGTYESALTQAQEALERATEPKEKGLNWRLQGDVYRAMGDEARAEAAYQQSRDALADHNPFECARTLLALGQHYTDTRLREKAEALLRTALDTFEQLDLDYYTTATRSVLGWEEEGNAAPPIGEESEPETAEEKAPPEPSPEPVTAGPQSLTRFVRKELLATGGYGEVYRGEDTAATQEVVIKRLRPELVAQNPDVVARFDREAEVLRQLDHPNIVKMLTAQETAEGYIIVMEYAPGGSLRDLLQQQPQLPLSQVLDIALELADALSRTHHLGVIHRDLKPGNVLLAADGSPRLTDFGIAYMAQEETRLTQTGAIVGTVAYLSPEACSGQELDARGDVWAFGVMLYEMLAGRHPFLRDSAGTTLVAILHEPLPDLLQIRNDLPIPLVDLIERMVVKEREGRISRMRQIAAELEIIRDNVR
jgi:tetratricopeptide (TPR) repeat protein/tRNA A-37 threonylcarbamoyl transferase component Bud32/transcriptional regulator with XRE-family HTH domain